MPEGPGKRKKQSKILVMLPNRALLTEKETATNLRAHHPFANSHSTRDAAKTTDANCSYHARTLARPEPDVHFKGRHGDLHQERGGICMCLQVSFEQSRALLQGSFTELFLAGRVARAPRRTHQRTQLRAHDSQRAQPLCCARTRKPEVSSS